MTAAALKGIESDVVWNDAAAELLASQCDTAASAIDGQSLNRTIWATKALVDFRGHFADRFGVNARTARGDADEVVLRLRDVANAVRRLQEEAHKEQQRREVAREWQARQDARSDLDKLHDSIFGGEPMPVGPAADPIAESVVAPASTPRQTPAPGSAGSGAGSGGGTSSARPSSLDTFGAASAAADEQLAPWPGKLRDAAASFSALCQWGTLNADPVFTGFAAWLAANAQDVRWARVVASAFAAAGGKGAVSSLPDASLAAVLRANKVQAARTDLTVDPAQIHGAPPTSGYADDPVNTATGNFIEPETDLGFPGAAELLSLSRCYNSFASLGEAPVGVFGRGWASVCEAGLSFDAENGTADLRLPDGRLVRFPRLGSGWDRAVGESLWLAADAHSAELVVSGNDGSWWRLTSTGVLLAYGVGPESTRSFVRVGRDNSGRVTTLAHARGQQIDLVWAGDRVVSASTSDGREVAYGYDGDRLTHVFRPGGDRTYAWSVDGLIIRVVDADGVVEVDNRYDERGRVVSQRSPYGRTSRYTYLPGNITVVADEDGTRANTWLQDERGRLIGVIDASGARQSTSYDRWGNPVLVTERDGATTVHEYDARGRRVRTVTPSGADVTYGYDQVDRVTTVVTEQGAVTAYTYAEKDRNPAAITDPEGGLTRLHWSDGLLRRVVDPAGVALEFGYDERGDLVSTSNAFGDTARLERDRLGRVTAAISPSGHRTAFAWDPADGTLTSRTDPDGAVWTYVYTAAGRLMATVDPLGARTEMARGDHGDEIETTDALGRRVSREVDDLGNLASVGLPDGSRWRFCYDALSRLVSTTDPTGGVWSQAYDQSGRSTTTIDPTGVRLDVERSRGNVSVRDGDSSASSGFDPLGRLTRVTQPDGSASLCVYDRCGRVVESLDADGGLTLTRRDPAGRPVETVSPSGLTTAYGYDRCGRLVSVTDPSGATTAIGYDADSNPVTQTLPTGETARTRYDGCGRVVEHYAPGAGTSRYGYDACGRVISWASPTNGTSTYHYDAAGQLVASIDGNGGVTSYAYDDLGRAVEIVTPVGGVIRRAYDAMGRCVAETDPLGRTTRAGYDAAGRLAWQEGADGHRLSWTYDAAGLLVSMAVDGRTVTQLSRDTRGRTVRILDSLDPERPREHELVWNARGLLVRRARDGRAVTWSYDAEGRRVAMMTPDGASTRYGYDACGRVVEVDHSLLGRAAFDRDAAGRILSALAGGLVQSWQHRDGFVVAHAITDADGSSRTTVERDADGRVQRVTTAEATSHTAIGTSVTDYRYDGANQLVEMELSTALGRTQTHWTYDAGGRLVGEHLREVRERQVTEATVENAYDLAGQLLSSVESDGIRSSYGYDLAGRRILSDDGRGLITEYEWNPTGYLAGLVQREGDRVRRTRTSTDALGELADVDGREFWWDSAGFAGAPVLAGETAVLAAGPVTGIGSSWTAPGWRTARDTGVDPWSASGKGASEFAGDLGAGLSPVSIGSAGEVLIDGLEWMGSRVYDAGARGFLSVDPLDPVVGAGWSSNPYSFAGNDPLHALDPVGLSPVTDAQLASYRNNSGLGGTLNNLRSAVDVVGQQAGAWLKNNYEYVAGGAMIVAGGVLMATGVGGPAGVMLVSAGINTVVQKATTGQVNWGEVAVSGVAGAVGGGVGATVAKSLAKSALSCGPRTILTGMAAGGAEGAINGGGTYLTHPGPHTLSGLAAATAIGGTVGGVTGGIGGAGAHGAMKAISKIKGTPYGCFVAGTEVLMADGKSKPIEEVELGDLVASFNVDTGETWPQEVVEVIKHLSVPTIEITTIGGTSVETTADHPFMVIDAGWTRAQDLAVGDNLLDPHGHPWVILTVRCTQRMEAVFNLKVGTFHTYFVGGRPAWLLVHNYGEESAGDFKDHIVLARSMTIDEIAQKIGARHLMQSPDFRREITRSLADNSVKISVALDYVPGTSTYAKISDAAMRGLRARANPFDWEMNQLYHSGRLPGADIWEWGEQLVNPFA